jgi:hypothetical protein
MALRSLFKQSSQQPIRELVAGDVVVIEGERRVVKGIEAFR